MAERWWHIWSQFNWVINASLTIIMWLLLPQALISNTTFSTCQDTIPFEVLHCPSITPQVVWGVVHVISTCCLGFEVACCSWTEHMEGIHGYTQSWTFWKFALWTLHLLVQKCIYLRLCDAGLNKNCMNWVFYTLYTHYYPSIIS